MKRFILMADVIKSGEQDPIFLMENFKSIIKQVNKKFKTSIESPLTITLGDEFQGVISNLYTSIEIIIFIEESILKEKLEFKLRFVLFEGEINTLINDKRAFEMLGSGLTRAREILTSMKESDHRFYISIENKSTSEILFNALLLLQLLTDQWKPSKDYEIAYNFIIYQDYKTVSDSLKRNRSVIWKREKTLNMESYYAIKNILKITSKLNPR